MHSPFQAQQLNRDIFETIYYHALKASAELAAKEGPYETYEGSPVSKVFLSLYKSLFLVSEKSPIFKTENSLMFAFTCSFLSNFPPKFASTHLSD
jgi:ribonucleotide reductase alpha subunit